MSAKKKPAMKRPPRQVWVVVNVLTGYVCAVRTTKRAAQGWVLLEGAASDRVVGPYCLLERVREK